MDKIEDLEKFSRLLEPNSEQRKYLFENVIAYSEKFLERNKNSKCYIKNDLNDENIFLIDEQPVDIKNILEILNNHVDNDGINLTSGKYLGYIPGGGLYHAALGDYLAAVTNKFAGISFVSPGAVKIENSLIKWMSREIGYPENSAGNLTSGGSISSLSAVVAARDDRIIENNKIKQAVVYLTDHTHHCIEKALHIAGLSSCIKRRIPVDEKYRMSTNELRKTVRNDLENSLIPWLVVGTAGTTNTGSVDPLTEIHQIASEFEIWFHVDGAYGGLYSLTSEGKEILKGLEYSDSVVLDPHKTLFLPYGTGTVILRNRAKLYKAFNADADYIENTFDNETEISPSDLSPELSKHFRGLRLWLSLKINGISAFRAALSEKIYLARYFFNKLNSVNGFEMGPFPDLSISTYRYIPKNGDADSFNMKLMKEIQNEGKIFISSTRLAGKVVLRAAIQSFRTHRDEIDEAIEVLEYYAKRLETN